MNIFEIAICIGPVLFTLYMLNPLYIVFKAMRRESQDKLTIHAPK